MLIGHGDLLMETLWVSVHSSVMWSYQSDADGDNIELWPVDDYICWSVYLQCLLRRDVHTQPREGMSWVLTSVYLCQFGLTYTCYVYTTFHQWHTYCSRTWKWYVQTATPFSDLMQKLLSNIQMVCLYRVHINCHIALMSYAMWWYTY